VESPGGGEPSERAARGPWTDRAIDTGEIDRPHAVVLEIVGTGHQTVQSREVFEQRIARPRHEDLVARIGKELEQQGVRLAGAGGQCHAVVLLNI